MKRSCCRRTTRASRSRWRKRSRRRADPAVSPVEPKPLSARRRVLDQAPAINDAVLNVGQPNEQELPLRRIWKAEMRAGGVPEDRDHITGGCDPAGVDHIPRESVQVPLPGLCVRGTPDHRWLIEHL